MIARPGFSSESFCATMAARDAAADDADVGFVAHYLPGDFVRPTPEAKSGIISAALARDRNRPGRGTRHDRSARDSSDRQPPRN